MTTWSIPSHANAGDAQQKYLTGRTACLLVALLRNRRESGASDAGYEPVESCQIPVHGNSGARTCACHEFGNRAGLRWVDLERDGTIHCQPVRKLPDEPIDQHQPLSTTVQSDPWLGDQVVISVDLVGPKVGEIGEDKIDRLLEPVQQITGPELDAARAQSVGVLLSDQQAQRPRRPPQ